MKVKPDCVRYVGIVLDVPCLKFVLFSLSLRYAFVDHFAAIPLRASISGLMGDIIAGRKEADDMSSLLTLTGVYRDGRVEFAERPAGVGDEVPVLVTFLRGTAGNESRRSTRERPRRLGWRCERFLARLKQGMPFGGPPYPTRGSSMTDSIAATKILVDTDRLIYAADLEAGAGSGQPEVLDPASTLPAARCGCQPSSSALQKAGTRVVARPSRSDTSK